MNVDATVVSVGGVVVSGNGAASAGTTNEDEKIG